MRSRLVPAVIVAVTIAFVFSILSLTHPGRAEACSCQGPGPACAELFLSTVFVGKVTKVVSNRGSDTTTFEVVETLNSTFPLPKTVTITHGNDGNVCGIAFTQGKTYVVYSGGTSATTLGVGACTNTHRYSKDDPDVKLAHAKVTRTTALVEGRAVVSQGSDSKPLAGVEVRAVGTKISARSNAAGAFTLEVPPGAYTLEVLNQDLRIWQDRKVQFNVPSPAACAHPIVMVSYDGRVEGTVTDTAGAPVVGLEVHAIAKREGDRHWRLSAKTDATGHYLIHEVPAGTFLVGVSLPDYGGTSPQSPHPTTYYPGTPSLAKAKALAIKQAGLVGSIDFKVPAPTKVVTLSGTVRGKSGAPLPGVGVTIIPAGRNRSTGGSTDAKGSYSMQELAGEDVVIRACAGSPQVCVEDKRKTTTDAVIDLQLP